ncbi:flagellar hook-basal body complex protein [Sulfuricurvum sp.]|uniref:flagellar hook-basal body complex protein n=1 Tax=Sulfuricurvum sp. TaxID=2025608 RepID=UPI002E2FC381|nr:flagellar hook-basal body complex protein [Sulfuricurvum sp.]HEX5330822.1 flagellar hook-basal body complex protein [Sulfuricurvum sp.]
MNQAYYSGISGVMTYQLGLDVVSDNIANVNTVGYKGSTAEFADLLTQQLVSAGQTPTSNDIGLGSRLQSTTTQMQNGSLLPSERFNDLAISGNGWFGVVSGKDTSYTRAGNFVFDEVQKVSGDVNSSVARLTTTDGKYVMGTMLTNYSYSGSFDYGDNSTNGVTGAYVVTDPTNEANLGGVDSQGMLEFPTRLAYPVEPTTTAQFFGNLPPDNQTHTISADVISGTNDRNRLKLTFTQSATQPATGIAWDVVATVTSNDGSIVYDTQNGQAIFDGTGGLSSCSITSMDNDGTSVAVDLGSSFNGVISIDGLAASGSSRSNGVSGGVLTKYGINPNGVIVADFSNGRQSAIGRIAVYHFQNDQGLNRIGNTEFQATSGSGDPLFWTDASGNPTTGAIINSGQLENSNVRLDVSLTDMIIMQRAYQANAKTITTGDELIQKALQMHR